MASNKKQYTKLFIMILPFSTPTPSALRAPPSREEKHYAMFLLTFTWGKWKG
jgi:hypothetical protein